MGAGQRFAIATIWFLADLPVRESARCEHVLMGRHAGAVAVARARVGFWQRNSWRRMLVVLLITALVGAIGALSDNLWVPGVALAIAGGAAPWAMEQADRLDKKAATARVLPVKVAHRP